GTFRTIDLAYPDQELSFNLTALTRNLAEIITRERPTAIMTVPYEGGHPDHDSTAFAVAQAIAALEEWNRPTLLEMSAYHFREGACVYSRFLQEAPGVLTLTLS